MTPNPTPETAPVGRPAGKSTRDPAVVAIENAERSISRLLWYLQENPGDNLGQRLARLARAGVERARADRALALVKDAVSLAETQMVAAYAAPQREEGVQAQRPTVSL